MTERVPQKLPVALADFLTQKSDFQIWLEQDRDLDKSLPSLKNTRQCFHFHMCIMQLSLAYMSHNGGMQSFWMTTCMQHCMLLVFMTRGRLEGLRWRNDLLRLGYPWMQSRVERRELAVGPCTVAGELTTCDEFEPNDEDWSWGLCWSFYFKSWSLRGYGFHWLNCRVKSPLALFNSLWGICTLTTWFGYEVIPNWAIPAS